MNTPVMVARSVLWALFACVYAATNVPKDAATRADALLECWDERFNRAKPGA